MVGIEWVKSNLDVKWFIFSVIFLVVCGIIEWFIKVKRYGIIIEINAGSIKLFIFKDESFINRIINIIVEIMNN